MCLDRYSRDETALLKREIRHLTELLEQERQRSNQQQTQKEDTSKELIDLKSLLFSFEDKFRFEVGHIHEQYKTYQKDWKAKKKQQLVEL